MAKTIHFFRGVSVYKGASNDDIYTAFKEIPRIRTLPSTGRPMYQTIKGKHLYVVNQVYIIGVPQQDGSTVVK
ncbi:hypothetical protein ACH8I4_07290 [Acinetobacter sp. ABJ_C3_5]|uniref:hypothetical protein n=1 Tax=Acinetobacter courvalinii TaxID=280147 RepID=UPI0037CC2F8D